MPTPLLANGHAMTIAAALFRPSAPLAGTVERVFTTDAETRVLALCNWQPDRAAAPTILALHGLTGSADAAYLRGLAAKAYARGFNVVRLNTRNCGNTEHLTPTLYHSGLTADCRAVLDQLLQDNLQPPFLVGYSMGGNVALKLCCELGDEAPRLLRSVVAVSPPIDLASASRAIDTGWFNSIYQRSFLRFLTRLVRAKAARHPDRYSLTGLDRIRTLRTFDDRYIAPMFGFAGVDDYYARASSGPLLDRLRLPTLVIQAKDDSIIPMPAFETWAARAPTGVDFLITDHGGHTGFIGRTQSDEDRYWVENRIVEWIE